MIDLNEARKVFAQYLANEPSARWRMDAALAHVVEFAYRRGLEDGKKDDKQQN